MATNTCKLCGTQAKLIKAHIIPKSMYGELCDENGMVTKLLTNTPRVYPKRVPCGIYDSTIVCASCEALFSPWDDYANSFFQRRDGISIEHQGRTIGIEYADYDYTKLKLFFVSMLWRAHASSQPFFHRVNLGSHEDRIKSMIFSGDPGSTYDYSVVLAKFDHELGGAFQDPYLGKLQGINNYRFYFPMYFATIKVDKRSFPQELSEIMLKPGEPCRIVMRDFAKSKEARVLFDIVDYHKGNL